jgi:hypothetical protein
MSWFTHTDRWPTPVVPPPEDWPDDIRVTTRYAALSVQCENLVQEIEALFQASPEIAALRATFDDEVQIAMRMSSSRKYTRFEFPNCPGLLAGVLEIFAKHELGNDMPRLANHRNFTIEIGTLRIGPVNETFYFGVPRGDPHPG